MNICANNPPLRQAPKRYKPFIQPVLRPKKRYITIIILGLIFIGLTVWYTDPFHDSVEPISKLIGKDYNYALSYFGNKPDIETSFSIRSNLNEFQGGVLSNAKSLKDSMVKQYTWAFTNHKVTIWVGSTMKSDWEIIDAIRYKNNIVF